MPALLYAENAESILSLYEGGNYKQVAVLVYQKFYKKKSKGISPELLKIYIKSETVPEKAGSLLTDYFRRPRQEEKSEEVAEALVVFLEKCLLTSQWKSGLEWGMFFTKEYVGTQVYPEGLYLYSIMLFESGKESDARFIALKALKNTRDPKLKEKLQVLRQKH